MHKRWLVIILLLLICFSSVRPLAASQVTIYLPEQVEVNSPEVFLGDIADISADNGDAGKLADIKLEKIHDPGQKIEISRRLVELHVRNSDYSYADFQVEGAEKVRVEIKTRTVTREKIFSAVREKIEGHFQELDEYQNFEFTTSMELRDEPEELIIPDGSLEVQLPRNSFTSGGNVNQPVEVYIDGKRWQRLYLNLYITHELKAYKLTENVSRGERVTDSTVARRELELENISENLVVAKDSELLAEGVFRRNFTAGEILTTDMLELPVLVDRGDLVTARVQVGNVEILVEMIARDRGKSGDIITLENKNTGERVEAEVLNRDMVRIIE